MQTTKKIKCIKFLFFRQRLFIHKSDGKYSQKKKTKKWKRWKINTKHKTRCVWLGGTARALDLFIWLMQATTFINEKKNLIPKNHVANSRHNSTLLHLQFFHIFNVGGFPDFFLLVLIGWKQTYNLSLAGNRATHTCSTQKRYRERESLIGVQHIGTLSNRFNSTIWSWRGLTRKILMVYLGSLQVLTACKDAAGVAGIWFFS